MGFLPGIGAELGLPAGFTFGVGTVWVGGDSGGPNVFAGLSPYFQLRYHILGAKDGQGFQLGASATYKFVGFGANGAGTSQDPGEMEWPSPASTGPATSRSASRSSSARTSPPPTPTARSTPTSSGAPSPSSPSAWPASSAMGSCTSPSEPPYDIISGGIASVTFGRWQIAALGGESTVNLNVNAAVNVGALGEVFATARF